MQQPQSNPVVWFEIYVQDMPRAKAFYEQVLGIQLKPLAEPGADPSTQGMEMFAFDGEMDRYGATGALVRMKGVPSGGSTMVYFGSDDCAVELGRVEAAGGKLFKEKFSLGEHGFCGIGIDPDCNMFGVHSMK